jgi:serine/threonine-protein kinase RsbW
MVKTETVTFPGRFDSLGAIAEFAARAAKAAGMDSQTVYAVQLAVDEACANIIEHAYGGEGGGEIECTCEVSPARLRLVLRDSGRSFDPASIPPPDLDSELEQRQVGGLGLFLIHKIMDEVRFEFGEGGNTLTLVKHMDPSA